MVIVPHQDAAGRPTPVGTVVGQQHKLSLLAVVGGELVLPTGVEPYGPHDSEQAASLRLLDRSAAALGRRPQAQEFDAVEPGALGGG